jgi:uncharacterized protein YbjQ (UPF0145 family)
VIHYEYLTTYYRNTSFFKYRLSKKAIDFGIFRQFGALFKLKKSKKMILSTTDQVPGREIESILGISQGSTVRARNIGRDFMAGLKNIVGGEISEYTILLAESRDQAIDRMVMDAEDLGADAVINIRFQTAMVMQGCSEILAYGTAVKLK